MKEGVENVKQNETKGKDKEREKNGEERMLISLVS